MLMPMKFHKTGVMEEICNLKVPYGLHTAGHLPKVYTMN
jgi:hypothetical protein